MIPIFCHDCASQLNEFETNKVHALEDYWGGTRKIEPRCAGCYHENLNKRKLAGTISAGQAT